MTGDAQQAHVLEGLDPQQRAAVLAPPGPVRILAGAGTGKTRTITRRMAHLAVTGQVSPDAILAVTHSSQAAGELRDRIQSLGVTVEARTFHSAAMSQLRRFWSRTGLPGDRLTMIQEIPDGQRGFLSAALAFVVGTFADTDVQDLDNEVEWARRSRLTPDEYAAGAKTAGRVRNLSADVLAAAYARYEQAKRSSAVLDFGDTIEQCALLLEQNREVADQFREQYRCFVVDEYQDTDPAQERLLAAWLGPENNNVTVVGDPNQTIYSFKGADPSLLVGFADRYPGVVSISLDRDYRSTPQIAAAANRLMARDSKGVELKGQRPPGPEPVFRTFDTETVEADGVAERVRELVASGVAPSEIAVLVRTRSQVSSYRTALRNAGLATNVADNEEFFTRPEIREAMTLLADLAEQSPHLTGLAGLRNALRDLGFDPEVPPAGQGAARARLDAWETLWRIAEHVPDDVRKTVGTLLAELRHRAEAEHTPRGGSGVTVDTMHKAKGLEWDVVLLPALTEGYLPVSHAKSPEATAEERRLLYVAVTRARERLELSRFTQSDMGRDKMPSRFLKQVVPPPSPPATMAAAATRSVYSAGDRVLSTSFGLGKVTEVDKVEVTIDFGDQYGVRKLRVTDPNLSRL